MTRMEAVPCNLCGNDDYTIAYQVPDLLLGNGGEQFSFVRCKRCGLVYQNPRPSQAEIGRFYPPEYEPYYEERPGNWLVKKVNQSGIEKRCQVINRLSGAKKGGRILDIGCSTGLFLDRLQHSGPWETWGVEPSEHAARIAREKYGLNVFRGDLFQANYQENFFDVITLWDVLEHLPDPSKEMAEIRRISKAGGALVLRVPVCDSLDAKIFGSSWAGLDAPRHYYVFSKRDLQALLQANGYELPRKSINIGVYPTFLLSLRFWLSYHGTDKAVSQRIYAILNHPVAKLVAGPFFYFYGIFGCGSEITLVARKK